MTNSTGNEKDKKDTGNASTQNKKKEIPGEVIPPQYLKDNAEKKPKGKPLHG